GQRTLEQVLPFIKFSAYRMPGVVTSVWKRILPTEIAFQMATQFEINGELIRREDFFPYLEHLAEVDPLLYIEMLAAAGRHSALDLLPQITVPTLIATGDRDGFTPMHLSEEMHEKIKGSEFFVVEGGTHTTPIEFPVEFTNRVVDFLQRHFPA